MTPEEIFGRLEGDEYFSISRSFIHISSKTKTIDRYGNTVDSDYLIAYKNRTEEHETMNLFDFAKKVFILPIYY